MSIQLAPRSRQSPVEEADKTALNTTPSEVGSQAWGERKGPLRCPCALRGPLRAAPDCTAEPGALRSVSSSGSHEARLSHGRMTSELLRKLRGDGHTGDVSWRGGINPCNEQPQAVALDRAWSSWVRGAAGSSGQALCSAWHRLGAGAAGLPYSAEPAHPLPPPGATPPGSQTEAVSLRVPGWPSECPHPEGGWDGCTATGPILKAVWTGWLLSLRVASRHCGDPALPACPPPSSWPRPPATAPLCSSSLPPPPPSLPHPQPHSPPSGPSYRLRFCCSMLRGSGEKVQLGLHGPPPTPRPHQPHRWSRVLIKGVVVGGGLVQWLFSCEGGRDDLGQR